MTALLCLIAQLGAFGHAAIVRHTTCVDHNAVVHGEGKGPAGPVGHAPSVATLGGREADEEHDDHCRLFALRREGAALAPALGHHVVDRAPLGSDAGGMPLVVVALGPPLLLLAPKNSPPYAL